MFGQRNTSALPIICRASGVTVGTIALRFPRWRSPRIGQRNGELSGGGRESAGQWWHSARSGAARLSLPCGRGASCLNSQRYARPNAADDFKPVGLVTCCGLGTIRAPLAGGKWLGATGRSAGRCPTGRSGPAAGGRLQSLAGGKDQHAARGWGMSGQ